MVLKLLSCVKNSSHDFRLDRLVSKDIEIDGIVLPAGSTCTAMVYAMHHDPDIYPDPFKFDPDR